MQKLLTLKVDMEGKDAIEEHVADYLQMGWRGPAALRGARTATGSGRRPLSLL
jgi:hypothetical protein